MSPPIHRHSFLFPVWHGMSRCRCHYGGNAMHTPATPAATPNMNITNVHHIPTMRGEKSSSFSRIHHHSFIIINCKYHYHPRDSLIAFTHNESIITVHDSLLSRQGPLLKTRGELTATWKLPQGQRRQQKWETLEIERKGRNKSVMAGNESHRRLGGSEESREKLG